MIPLDHFWLCTHLDRRGFACNRRTMTPLTPCSEHRPKAASSRGRGPTPEYQRARRARKARAGLSPAMEGAAA